MGALPDYLQQAWPTERQLERFRLNQPLRVTMTGAKVVQGNCLDVSVGGVGASIVAPLQLGQEVGLEFQLPERDVPLQLKAVVRYLEGEHCGFEFLTIRPEDRDAILAYRDSLDKKKRPKILRR